MPEHPPLSTLDEKRRNLDAYLKAEEQGIDAGLAELANRSDPDALAIRLGLLVEAKRFDEAAGLVRSLPSHKRWCRTAIYVFVQTGERPRARELVEWARANLKETAQWQACCAAFVESMLMFLQMPPPTYETVGLQPGSLNEEQKALLSEAITVLEPATQAITIKNRLTSTLETMVAEDAFKCHFLLRHKLECQQFYRLLETRHPIPLLLAQYCLSDWLEINPPDDFPARLRAEHPSSREARMYAATIEAVLPSKHNEAFEAAIILLTETLTAEERQTIAELLLELKPRLDGPRRERCGQILSKLVDEMGSDQFAVLTRAEMAYRDGNAGHAAAILDGRRDENDVHWLQLRANCHLAASEKVEASRLLRHACKLFPTPTLLRRATDAAFASNDFDGAREVLKQLAIFEPNDVRVWSNLANLAVRSGQMMEAAGHYARLRTLQPDEPQHLFNEASCLVQANQPDLGKQRFDELCQNPGRFERDAFLSRAQVLKVQNDSKGAFDSLTGSRDKYWDDIEFVSFYLSLAFASGHDDQGHEALMRVMELQKEAGTPQIMEAVPFDTLKERLQGRGEAIRQANQDVLNGNLPWLLADSVGGNVPYAAMMFRTQPVRWLGDDPLARARFSVYATDAFIYRPEHLTDKTVPLAYEIMQCAPRDTSIVVDQTALITLYRLELLNLCASYFGNIFFPIGYLSHVLEDSNALVFHQSSWLESLSNIRLAVDREKIGVVDDEAGLTRVDEYDQADDATKIASSYRLRDVVNLLSELGKISDAKEEESQKLFHQQARFKPGEPDALQPGQPVLVSLTTLRSLTNAGHFDALLETLNVRLSRADYNMLNAETHGADYQRQTYQQHVEMWEQVQRDTRFSETDVFTPDEFQGAEMDESKVRHLSSAWLAGQKKAALMADDRLLQRLAVHMGADAFGTDRLLLTLGHAEMLPWDEVAEKFLTLVRWRYRFLVPCPEIMLALSKRHSKRPPGQPLRELAFYFHDCMRDSGLPSGYADNTPGSSLAHTFFYKLTSMAGEFAVDVWADAGYEPDAANALTHWIARSLLPAAPKYLRDGRTMIIVAQSARIMMSAAFVRAVKIKDVQQANLALRAIASALALDDREYEQILTSVLYGI